MISNGVIKLNTLLTTVNRKGSVKAFLETLDIFHICKNEELFSVLIFYPPNSILK